MVFQRRQGQFHKLHREDTERPRYHFCLATICHTLITGTEILKQPMHTSVALEKKDFGDFSVQEGLHIGIVVKDFRSIVAHAETLHVDIEAKYSQGNRPMQMTYRSGGLSAEFTLMTRGHAEDLPSSATQTPRRDLSVRPASEAPQSSRGSTAPAPTEDAATMRPPQKKARLRDDHADEDRGAESSRNSPPAPSASINPNSLFIPDDNDQQWDEPDYNSNPDLVMWDTGSEVPSASTSMRRIQDSTTVSYQAGSDRRLTDDGIAPTQRLSQVRGLFD